jgi:hypothetical protein
MKKSCAIAIASVLVLAGCQCFVKSDPRRELDGFDPRLVRQPHPLFPNISLSDGGKIVLDQTPIRIKKEHVQPDGKVTISWALPAGSAYSFPANGIQMGPVPTKERPRTPDKPVSCDGQAGGDTTQKSASSAVAQRPGVTAQQRSGSYSISPFYVTSVELGAGYQTSPLENLSCKARPGASKIFECTFTAPKQPSVHKYSVYVCRGKELFDSYDPYVVSDI